MVTTHFIFPIPSKVNQHSMVSDQAIKHDSSELAADYFQVFIHLAGKFEQIIGFVIWNSAAHSASPGVMTQLSSWMFRH